MLSVGAMSKTVFLCLADYLVGFCPPAASTEPGSNGSGYSQYNPKCINWCADTMTARRFELLACTPRGRHSSYSGQTPEDLLLMEY